MSAADVAIPRLGECRYASPIRQLFETGEDCPEFVSDEDRILLDDRLSDVQARLAAGEELPALELAGPRSKIFFDPAGVTCGIVTCGGLCPGLNDVIRSVVMQAHHRYGVKRILGFRYGYEGLIPEHGHDILELTPRSVSQIHQFGGSVLGVSRGPQDVGRMVDRLVELGVNLFFVVGGDGSQRGAGEIATEAYRRGLRLSVIGIPKTIDSDLMWLDKSFGYETAFAAAVAALSSAHTEALCSTNGIGLVKLMGRDSGFIACSATLASGEANYVLIPELPFALEGQRGLLAVLEERLRLRGHALIVVAEGAGQDLIRGEAAVKDASGNQKHKDIGLFLKGKIEEHFGSRGVDINLKYIDPSYMIRSIPAEPDDQILCLQLARHAVHAGMAGKTGILVGRVHNQYVHLPIPMVTSGRRKVDTTSDFWLSVLESTGQPLRFG